MIFTLIITIFCIISSPSYAKNINAENFHPPQTEAEIALDRAMKLLEENLGATSILLRGEYGEEGSRKLDFRKILTEPLIQALIEAEREFVMKDCGGEYIVGDSCGLGFNPIICAQDFVEHEYMTKHFDGEYAYIVNASIYDNSATTDYILRKINGKWKIDGIKCSENFIFNMESDK